MSKIGAWLAGILAVVIASCVTWYINGCLAHTATTFEGRVYSNNLPVANAEIVLHLNGTGLHKTAHDWTDEHGSYRLEAADLPKNTSASLSVTATGYERAPTLWLQHPLEVDNQTDVPLISQAIAHLGPSFTPVRPAGPSIMQPYLRKQFAVKIK